MKYPLHNSSTFYHITLINQISLTISEISQFSTKKNTCGNSTDSLAQLQIFISLEETGVPTWINRFHPWMQMHKKHREFVCAKREVAVY